MKCLAFFLGFCEMCLHRQLRKNNKEITRSLLTRSNALCRIAFCFRKNDLCVNICFPYARTLVYYHPSPPFYSERFSLSLMQFCILHLANNNFFKARYTQVSLLAFCITRRVILLVPRIFSNFLLQEGK